MEEKSSRHQMVTDFPEPEVFTLNCPTQQILDLISNKWLVIILYCLAYRPKRYNEILRQIEGISPKVLTQSLRKLEKYQLIQRLSVEYSLTVLGESLMVPLSALANWSRANIDKMIMVFLVAFFCYKS